MANQKGPKPAKPYKDFPLFPHGSGQWAKKINGRMHYFGTWNDPEAARTKYLRRMEDLQAGRVPRETTADGYTLEDLATDFLTEKKIKLDEGRLSPRMMADYQKTCAMLIKRYGRHRLVDDFRPEDFRELRAKLGTGPKGKRGIVSIANDVRMIRIVFKFASDNDSIDRPVNFGTGFKLPSKTDLRGSRQARGKREFSPEEIRRLLDVAGIPLKAMILLAINAGFGPTDIAQLPIAAVDLNTGWMTFPRPKTKVDRRAKLWKETIVAIQDAIRERPKPKNENHAGLIFITQIGQPWVRCREKMIPDGDQERLKLTFADAIGQAFKKLLVKLELNRDNANFYGLRHSFLTVADGARDKPATDLVMGHIQGGIDAEYRERIEDDRLEAIAKSVHQWLFPQKNRAKKLSKI